MKDGWWRNLEFPDAEAIRVINKLWSHYGDDAGCRADLDQLYPQVIEVLDTVTPYWFPTPSLNDIDRITRLMAGSGGDPRGALGTEVTSTKVTVLGVGNATSLNIHRPPSQQRRMRRIMSASWMQMIMTVGAVRRLSSGCSNKPVWWRRWVGQRGTRLSTGCISTYAMTIPGMSLQTTSTW